MKSTFERGLSLMTLPIAFVAKPPPLSVDDDGVLRVGGTRVRLETVINAFQAGCAAEAILLKYPCCNSRISTP